MKKEIIIVVIIVILIIIGHIITQNYTKKFFENISVSLEKIEEKIDNDNIEKQNLKNELDDIQEKWNEKYDILAYYIEHDELEKVETQLISMNANIKVQDYDKTIEELEKCKFILEHIKDKDSLKLVNIF
nr:DUF4363 family protein [Clostridia bacterium]